MDGKPQKHKVCTPEGDNLIFYLDQQTTDEKVNERLNQRFEYNEAGFKIKEIISKPGDGEQVTTNEVNALGSSSPDRISL